MFFLYLVQPAIPHLVESADEGRWYGHGRSLRKLSQTVERSHCCDGWRWCRAFGNGKPQVERRRTVIYLADVFRVTVNGVGRTLEDNWSGRRPVKGKRIPCAGVYPHCRDNTPPPHFKGKCIPTAGLLPRVRTQNRYDDVVSHQRPPPATAVTITDRSYIV